MAFWKILNLGLQLLIFQPHLPNGCSRRALSTMSPTPGVSKQPKKARIKKLLIANRGEIACRIMRSTRRLDIHSVAVYSDADRNAMHVKMSDSAFNIGPPPSRESYLCGDKILEVAKKTGADAIHPGYGFLSENAEFAESCEREGLIFVGPPASAIRDMGIKSTSKAIMAAAGVPIITGYHGEDQSEDRLINEADKIGFPIMIKAVRGGGGKGMRIAQSRGEFLSALESARREALKAFADDAVLLERYVNSPRHVEVQVFADQWGGCVYLFERDCSVQRRHQKVIEEAPAPGVSEELRQELGEAGVRAARAVGYVGAGTVEFILDPATLDFHFMEMNTRLQVEHPITEMITGTDLVEWQIKVASGEQLPLMQSELKVHGHSFEARIYAESPNADFIPGAGHLLHLSPPKPGPSVRVETGVQQGDEVSVHYDPMIAKLVVWGEDRLSAIKKLSQKLSEYQVVGLDTNLQFLSRLSSHPQFIAGEVHTGFIENHKEALLHSTTPSNTVFALAAIGLICHEKMDALSTARKSSPFTTLFGFRVNHLLERKVELLYNGKVCDVTVVYERDGSFTVSVGEVNRLKVTAELTQLARGLSLAVELDNTLTHSTLVVQDAHTFHLFTSDGVFEFNVPRYDGQTEEKNKTMPTIVSSPMPGVIEKLLVNQGQKVNVGEPLLVVIAMKMEHVIKSPIEGVVKRILYSVGDSVAKNVPLIQWQDETEI